VSPAWSEGRLSAFDTALVERVTDEAITLFGPYATSPSFVYGREPSVIPLIGAERYQIRRSSTARLQAMAQHGCLTIHLESCASVRTNWNQEVGQRSGHLPGWPTRISPDGAATPKLAPRN